MKHALFMVFATLNLIAAIAMTVTFAAWWLMME